MRVHLKTLGCRLNEAELETWARDFTGRGFGLADGPQDADLIVVNTCAVTGEAVRKSRQLLRRAHRENPNAKLVVSGCYSSLDPSDSQSIPGVDLVVENRLKDRLPQIVTESLDLEAAPLAGIEPGENLLFSRGRQRAFIKVQDGCRYRCTYCIVTLARGDERSRSPKEIINEINGLVEDGVREAVLTGVHLGGYESDQNGSLAQLVEKVLSETDIARLRLGSLEPWDIPEDFWELFDNPRLMPHLHLPIQSGSDRVLRRMARRGRRADFLRLATEARKRIPDLNITTDVIVGFPGETDEEFGESVSLVEEIGFGHVHVFSFSPRQGTKAAEMTGRIPDEIQRERNAQLHHHAHKARHCALSTHLGMARSVLVESVEQHDGDTVAWGYTPHFMRVAVESGAEALHVNQLQNVLLTDVHPDGHLVGRTTDDSY